MNTTNNNLKIITIPALQDNYIWLLYDAKHATGVIVDPGVAAPVLEILQQQQIKLSAILLTHHHWDHCNGVAEILEQRQVPVYGSANEENPVVTHAMADAEIVALTEPALSLQVIAIPGHTRGHVAYYGHGWVFSGDTLFTAGCGRLFEGTAPQMYHSLSKLAALPDTTEVYCGHEYTVNNLKFAQTVEPNNQEIIIRRDRCLALRDKGLPTVPASLSEEKQTNPFLRCQVPDVITSAENQFGQKFSTPEQVFAALRQWKDNF